jgi:chaperonin GroES
MKIRPLHDRVLIRRVRAEEKTLGGIIIPDTAQEKPVEGEVVAVGPGARNEQGLIVELEVRVGDRILFGKWSGNEVKLDSEELLIIKEADIMGIIGNAPIASKKAA